MSAVGVTAIASVSMRDDVVAIGPVLPEDIGAFYLWVNDVESAKGDVPYQPVDATVFKAWMDRGCLPTGECLLAIRLLQEQPAIGYVQLRNVHTINRSAELGARIGREKDRGKGYGTRAVALLIGYAFNTLNLNRVSLTVSSNNRRAIAAYHLAGFLEEGTLRQASYLNGAWVDMLMMSVLRMDRGV